MAVVVLQAGHCHRTSGSTGTASFDGDPTEQEFAWAVSHAAASKLRSAGHTPRVILADPSSSGHYAGDVFIGIHCDGSTSPNARGASAGFRNPNGQRLAAAWKRAYARLGWSGFRPDNYTAALQGYYGTRRAIAKGVRFACIIECGFLTSPEDEKALTNGGVERAAQAIVDAVAEVYGEPVTSTPAPSTGTVLRLGDRGEAVKLWQSLVGVTPDGAFGPATEAKTREFQAKVGLTADGIVGPQTRAAMKNLLAYLVAVEAQKQAPAKPAAPALPGLVRQGATGEIVRTIQQRLVERANQRITVDGVFGPATADAVRNVQRFFGVPVDGIVGPQTWGLLWL